jgi:hypothetical protein
MDQGNESSSLVAAVTTSSSKRGGGKSNGPSTHVVSAASVQPVLSPPLPLPTSHTETPPLVVVEQHSSSQTQNQQNNEALATSTATATAAETTSQPPLLLSVVHTEMLPPELRDVFEISSFIAHARPMMKPCFRTRTNVTKDSWIGAIFRRFHGESAMLGALQIQRISERLSSSLQQYRGKIWEPTIRNHLVDFLKGVKIIQETYYDYTEVTPILCTTILTGEHALNSVRISSLSQTASVVGSAAATTATSVYPYPGTSVSSQTN